MEKTGGEVIVMRVMPIPVQLRYLLSAALVCFILSVTGLYLWEQMPLNKDTQPGLNRTFGYTGSGIVGVILLFSFSTVWVVLLYESSQLFVRYAFLPQHAHDQAKRLLCVALSIQAVLGLFLLIWSSVLLHKLGRETASCGVIFCLGVQKHFEFAKTRGASFNFLVGFMAFCTLVPLSCVMWYRVYTLWLLQKAFRAVGTSEGVHSTIAGDFAVNPSDKNGGESHSDASILVANTSTSSPGEGSACAATSANPMAKPPSIRTYAATPWKKQLSRIIGLCLGIVACALLTFWLPNDPRRFHPANIARFANLTISRTQNTKTSVVPEMPYAWFRTGQIRVSQDLILKLFPGNVFFYVYLLSLAIIVFVLRQTQTGRYWMQRRIPRCACFTYGEAAFMAATAWLVLFFTIYWVRDHNYKNAWGNGINPKMLKWPERWGRGMGQLAILFLSLLLLPVGRQSVIVTVLGVSRDGLLWFHRAVGYCMLAATLAHITIFYYSFYEYGLLWHNLCFLPITIGEASVINDFTTIAATWTTWFLLVAMGIFSLNAMRRRFYELFYYAHLGATYMTLPMMIFHASAGWMYMLPGLTLFLADQLVRVWQRSAVVRVVHARTISEDTVELAFSVPGRWDMRCVHPGQYVLVCVPELTALQWHPFTLTSVVDEDGAADAGGVAVSTTGTVFYLHIKSMGPLTWTGRLYDMVRSGQVFSVGVEGPCGTPVDYSRYDDIVLVAGGIGAAPCVSVYGSLLRAHMRSADGAGVPRVRMVWSTRSASLVGAVADMLQLPVSYRGLVRTPQRRKGNSGTTANAPSTRSSVPAVLHTETTVEVPASQRVRNEDFALDVYITRSGELAKVALLDHEMRELSAAAAETQLSAPGMLAERLSGKAREEVEEEELVMERAAPQQPPVPAAVNRGARLRVFEGRPDLPLEIRSAFLNPATNEMDGDAMRKLVLVCGPEGMVKDVVIAAAEIGVAVHTEEFLF
ncbi:putative ferric reductase [Leptomonas pyrrhocoris]|uniref:Putative ferric reductase n=1 Tax=Leptomonas pyrrhocoris TaxID=157538 RepID=A0A0N0DXN4_LEPPY|nr:putative ferric reductase [Leptomonas pyrrhocoris]KPA83185.1 putative ferric reductase [Leptomonas pyrrhocoris]|eukprot:XP_015661624.1 putative ferric reductase [Leptomonas pyrrhocoris]